MVFGGWFQSQSHFCCFDPFSHNCQWLFTKKILIHFNTTDGSLESSTAELVTGVVETSSITIRNSAVYQQLLCIGQQCHNRYRALKEAAITNQPLNMICYSQCEKYNDNQTRNQKHIKIPKKTSAENLGCWHSGTPSWTELRGAGEDNDSEKGEPNLKIPFWVYGILLTFKAKMWLRSLHIIHLTISQN